MAGTTSILADRLHEYPQQNVIDGAATASPRFLIAVSQRTAESCHFCIVMLAGRFVPREKRLRLDAKSYYPDYMGGTGLDEIWMCCTVPIVTGVIDTRTKKAPFREGEAHCTHCRRTGDFAPGSDHGQCKGGHRRQGDGDFETAVW